MKKNYVKELFWDSGENLLSKKGVDCKSANEEWTASKLCIIDRLIKSLKILDDVEMFFVDTAPLHLNAEGKKDLSEECKVWLGGSFLKDLDASLSSDFIKAWIQTVEANQKSDIAPFQHPSFTGAIPIDEWSNLIVSCTGQDKQNSKTEGDYLERLRKTELSHFDFHERGDYLESDYYFKTSLASQSVPEIRDYYKRFNKDTILLPRLQGFFKEEDNFFDLADLYDNADISTKQEIADLLLEDLNCKNTAMKLFVDEKFFKIIQNHDNKLDWENTSHSILWGIPLWLHQGESTKINTNNIPLLYKGGIWIYVLFSSREKMEAQKENVNKVIRMTWMIYMDQYAAEAIKGRALYEENRVQNAFAHEIKYLGENIGRRWLAKTNEIFDFSCKNESEFVAFKEGVKIGDAELKLLEESSLCLLPSVFLSAGDSIGRWSMVGTKTGEASSNEITKCIDEKFIRDSYLTVLDELVMILLSNCSIKTLEQGIECNESLNSYSEFKELLNNSLVIEIFGNEESRIIHCDSSSTIWMKRGLMALMKNAVMHGDWTREVKVVVHGETTKDGKCKYSWEITNYCWPNSSPINYDLRKEFISRRTFFKEMEDTKKMAFLQSLQSSVEKVQSLTTVAKTSNVSDYCFSMVDEKNKRDVVNDHKTFLATVKLVH